VPKQTTPPSLYPHSVFSSRTRFIISFITIACTEGAPHTSLSFPAATNHDIFSLLACFVSTSAQQQFSLSAAIPSETALPTDWNSERTEEVKKPKHQRDLEKAQRIFTAQLEGQKVSDEEQTWAKNVTQTEEKLGTAGIEKQCAMGMESIRF
jgi:hypothetical protein